ncbi:hypothetical protein K469DRAFT_720388 [Zopfia rhizophila CBS 207.26]|uniref:FAR1 domain-containing protein n=1 Tax=Zopfia rhizophila CBS 207.26 TaxID=1314779 RepID=A0A6A6EK26_9PEZI|nr:hypothetical protein K469DRAFT_720388 [Zopfia rhizophila CBS 207.26]
MRSRSTLTSQHEGLEVPIYGPELPTSGPGPYPTYATSHNVDPSIDHISTFNHNIQAPMNNLSAPLDHQISNQHAHLHNSNLHLDPSLQSDPHHFPPQSPPLHHTHQIQAQTQQHAPPPPRPPTPPPPPKIPNSAPPGEFDMQPPPASTHRSWQALHDFAQSHASAHGYALSINTTAKNRSRIKLACVCYGAPKNTHKLTPETRVRKNRVSYKTGCKMWIEGKKQDDGLWVLRVGEGAHNHPGRSVEGWAVQRKRTWGVQGGRIGIGGVTAKEEKMRLDGVRIEDASQQHQNESETLDQQQNSNHSLERGGLVWRIVEQEMLRKGGPGQGRDRGVGRTVKVLQERLPGIHIFKRDVYNIRAQIKRARKAAGQQIGEGLDENDDSELMDHDQIPDEGGHEQEQGQEEVDEGDRDFPEIDPLLVAQCNDALRNVSQQQQESEVERLRREVEELRRALEEMNREVNEKSSENQRLRVELEAVKMDAMAMFSGRLGPTQ